MGWLIYRILRRALRAGAGKRRHFAVQKGALIREQAENPRKQAKQP